MAQAVGVGRSHASRVKVWPEKAFSVLVFHDQEKHLSCAGVCMIGGNRSPEQDELSASVNHATD